MKLLVEIKEGFAPRLELVQHQSESAWQSNRPPGARSLVRGLSPRCAHSQTIILKMCTSLALPISKTNNGLWLMTPTVQCPYEDRMLKDQTFATLGPGRPSAGGPRWDRRSKTLTHASLRACGAQLGGSVWKQGK